MNIRRWVLTPSVIALFILSAVALVPVLAQQQQQQQGQKVDKKLQKANEFDQRAVQSATDAAMAGQAPTDITMTFQHDSIKALGGQTYVPFTVAFEQAQAPAGKALVMYWRIVNKAQSATKPAGEAAKGKDDKSKRVNPEFAYQDIDLVTLTPPSSATEPYRLSRSFAVPPGEYDVFVTLRERLAPDAKDREKTRVKTGVLKQTVTVPNYWTEQLATSTIIVAEKIDILDVPPAQSQAKSEPYTIGMLQIVPAKTMKFSKKSEFSFYFQVYNAALGEDKKPDVTVENKFYRKVATEATGEKYFNATSPQAFNVKTLPAQWDASLGHPLPAGLSIPLGSFDEGEYRLEIKVTDKLSGKTITHEVKFFVTA
jgi:hypothetical protein